MSPKAKIKSGFTLIEVLVAATIFALAATAGLAALAQVSRANDTQAIISQTQQGADGALDNLTRQIQLSTAVYIAPGANSLTLKATDGAIHTYALSEDHKLTLDGTPLTPNSISISEFALSGLPSHKDKALTQPTDNLTSQPFAKINLTVLSARKMPGGSPYVYQLETLAVPRNWTKT